VPVPRVLEGPALPECEAEPDRRIGALENYAGRWRAWAQIPCYASVMPGSGPSGLPGAPGVSG
jgi:hypothetical protein